MSEHIKKKCKGQCPKCDSLNLEYGESGVEDENYFYDFVCNDCKATGTEWYNLQYDETILN